MSKIFTPDLERLAAAGSRGIVGLGLALTSRTAKGCALLYADVGSRFALNQFETDGNLCLNVGIAEQCMIGMAAGFAHEGLNAFAAAYGQFLIGRAFDQIKAAIGEMALPVKLISAPSGLCSGDLGNLSICVDDIAMLRTIPNLIIVSPADGLEAVKCIAAAAESDQPIYIRMTGGKWLAPVYYGDYEFQLGRAVPLREGTRLLLIATGAVTAQALAAADRLETEGIGISVLNMHTVKPLDTQTLDQYLTYEMFVTVEEHSICGGLGGAVAEYLAGKSHAPVLRRLGIGDQYFAADRYEKLLEEAGLSSDRIYHTLRSMLAE